RHDGLQRQPTDRSDTNEHRRSNFADLCPSEGSDLTTQIAPLRGCRAFAIKIFGTKRLEVRQLRIVAIEILRRGGSCLEDCVTLRLRKFSQFRSHPPALRARVLLPINFRKLGHRVRPRLIRTHWSTRWSRPRLLRIIGGAGTINPSHPL